MLKGISEELSQRNFAFLELAFCWERNWTSDYHHCWLERKNPFSMARLIQSVVAHITRLHRCPSAWQMSERAPDSWCCKEHFIKSYQLSDSGDTVFNLYFNFIHVLQHVFSNLALLLYAVRLDTICLHDDQRSSSFHLCDK
jgi:hypothetical protein